jgi:hypothetical protein
MTFYADSILIATSPSPELALNSFEQLTSGFVTGAITKTLTSPFDVVKTILQASGKGVSTSDTINQLWKDNGIAAFWRGNSVGVLKQGPQSALKFFVLEEFKKQFGTDVSSGQRAIFGATAGIISQSVVYPIDFIHTRILVNPKKYTGFFQAASTIFREEGISAFWNGIAPTVIGSIPFEGSQFVCVGGLTEFYKKRNNVKDVPPLVTGAIGAIAGAFSQTIAFPFDVVSKKMMAGGKTGQAATSLSTAKAIWDSEGVFGFFKGLSINMVKIVPYCAMQYTIHQQAKNVMLSLKAARLAVPAKGKK